MASMINWPDNPVSDIIRNAIYPVKTIRVSMPDSPLSLGCMAWVSYDAGMSIRDPRMESAGVKTTGWAKAADTYIYLPDHIRPEQLQEWLSEIGWIIGAGYMYRWHHAPGQPYNHLWGLKRYSIAGMDTAYGDANPDLAEMADKYGCWSWEINCAYRKGEGHTAMLLPKWREHDPTLTAAGSRLGVFPGWAGEHPWLRATDPNTGYESQYYFCKPKKYNRHKDVLAKEDKKI